MARAAGRWLALLPALLLAATLAGCASTSETNPGRTATEQLLMSRAADLALEGLRLPIPPGFKLPF